MVTWNEEDWKRRTQKVVQKIRGPQVRANDQVKQAPALRSNLNTPSVNETRLKAGTPDDNSTTQYQYEGGSAPSPRPTVTPGRAPTIKSETTAPTGQVVPFYSGQSKRGTGAVLATNTQGNPEGELVGNVSGLRARSQARNTTTTAEDRFRNAVQPGGRGRSARRPGGVVRDIKQASPADKLASEMNFDTIGDMIVSGNKLKAAKGVSEIEQNKRKNDLSQQELAAQERQESRKARNDEEQNRIYGENVAGQNAGRELDNQKSELELKNAQQINSLRQQLQNTEDPAERTKLATMLQQLQAKSPSQDRTEMTDAQRASAYTDARNAWSTEMEMKGEDERVPLDEWLKSDPFYSELLGTAGGGAAYPRDPAQRQEGKTYTTPDGRQVRWINGKAELVE